MINDSSDSSEMNPMKELRLKARSRIGIRLRSRPWDSWLASDNDPSVVCIRFPFEESWDAGTQPPGPSLTCYDAQNKGNP
jgi:hypothetical protein